MATFLLIGPSGSGKSTAAKIVSEKGDQISVFDLDKEIKKKIGGKSVSEFLNREGDEKFFEISKQVIEEISLKKSHNTLIIVGAGSINYKHSHEWYLKQNLISLTGNPQRIYERGDRQKFHPKVENYIETEFSASRENLYKNSTHIIDVTEYTPEQVADIILQKIGNNQQGEAGKGS